MWPKQHLSEAVHKIWINAIDSDTICCCFILYENVLLQFTNWKLSSILMQQDTRVDKSTARILKVPRHSVISWDHP